MTELDRMLTAARQIGEVVGEDLLAGVYVSGNPTRVSLDSPSDYYAILYDDDALDLLTARVWRAVRGWAINHRWSLCANEDGEIRIYRLETFGVEDEMAMAPDLPSAVAAIHKHWQESANPPDAADVSH